jgi:hypothetical protein
MSAFLSATQIQNVLQRKTQARIAKKQKKIKRLTEKKTELHETKARIANTNEDLTARSKRVQEREQFVLATVGRSVAAAAAAGNVFANTLTEIKTTIEQLKPLYAEEAFLLTRLEEVQKKIRDSETSLGGHLLSPSAEHDAMAFHSTVSTQKKKLSSTLGVVAPQHGPRQGPMPKLSEVPESERRQIHREEMLHRMCNPDLPHNLYDNCKDNFHLIARKRGWVEDEGITFDSVRQLEAGGSYEKAVELMKMM